jgi:hypothetical protein
VPNRETIALVIAQNGLSTAATILKSKALKQEKAADKATDRAEKEKLANAAKSTLRLVAALQAADEGIKSYMINAPE